MKTAQLTLSGTRESGRGSPRRDIMVLRACSSNLFAPGLGILVVVAMMTVGVLSRGSGGEAQNPPKETLGAAGAPVVVAFQVGATRQQLLLEELMGKARAAVSNQFPQVRLEPTNEVVVVDFANPHRAIEVRLNFRFGTLAYFVEMRFLLSAEKNLAELD
jgi:hypothetical protein